MNNQDFQDCLVPLLSANGAAVSCTLLRWGINNLVGEMHFKIFQFLEPRDKELPQNMFIQYVILFQREEKNSSDRLLVSNYCWPTPPQDSFQVLGPTIYIEIYMETFSTCLQNFYISYLIILCQEIYIKSSIYAHYFLFIQCEIQNSLEVGVLFGFSDLQLARGLETNLVQGVNQLKGSFKTGQSKLYTTLNLNPNQSLSVKLIW